MLTRTIPSTGETLPVVGLGTWQVFDKSANDDEASRSLTATLRALVDAGGSVVDSSPMYGNSEGVVGRLGKRAGLLDKLFVATKVWTRGEQAGVDQMNRSFELLQRDTIDLMQIHNLLDWRTHLRTLRAWKDAGRIRYIGVTHYVDSAYADIESIIRREPIDFAQFAYSPGYRAAEQSLLPACADRGVAVLVNRPFEEGAALRQLRGKPLPESVAAYASSWPEAFLKFIVSHPAVTSVIPATGSAEHMTDNCRAGTGRLPDAAEREELPRVIASAAVSFRAQRGISYLSKGT